MVKCMWVDGWGIKCVYIIMYHNLNYFNNTDFYIVRFDVTYYAVS